MNQKQLDILLGDREKRLTISFPRRVVSTNAEELREQLSGFWKSVDNQIGSWENLELDFRKTEFVDSIGLNLIFELVRLAGEKKAPIAAWLRSRAVRLIFYTVRLDKKMDIRLLENAENKEDENTGDER
jgi:anti-anti-sigma regulatory factor